MKLARFLAVVLVFWSIGGRAAADPPGTQTLYPLNAPVAVPGLVLQSCRGSWVQPDKAKPDYSYRVDALATGSPAVVFNAPGGIWNWSGIDGVAVQMSNIGKVKVNGEIRVTTVSGAVILGKYALAAGATANFVLPLSPPRAKELGVDPIAAYFAGLTVLAQTATKIERGTVKSVSILVTRTTKEQPILLRNLRLIPERTYGGLVATFGQGPSIDPAGTRSLYPLDGLPPTPTLQFTSNLGTWVKLAAGRADGALKIETFLTGAPALTFPLPAGSGNWSGMGGLAVEMANPTKIKLAGDLRVTTATGSYSAGWTIQPGKSGHFVLPLVPADPEALGMEVLPSWRGFTVLARPLTILDRQRVTSLAIRCTQTGKGQSILLKNVRLLPEISLTGIVDRFGQESDSQWPGKILAETDFAAQRAAERLAPPPADRDRFGGWLAGPRLRATGFFRVEKVNGKWWFVTPEGTVFFSLGVNTIDAGDFTIVTGREEMFTTLPDPALSPAHYKLVAGILEPEGTPVQIAEVNFRSANLQLKYGPDFASLWKAPALDRLLSWGFNTIGNWSDPGLAAMTRAPYAKDVHLWGSYRKYLREGAVQALPDPYDPRFASAARELIGSVAATCRDDPWCLGYFVNNELDWGDWDQPAYRYGFALKVLEASADAPAKQAFVAILQAKYVAISVLNSRWQQSYSSWENLAASSFPAPTQFTPALEEDLRILSRDFAFRYYSVVREAIAAVDGNHLYLGSRFRFSRKTPEVVEAAARACDVVSFNFYSAKVVPTDPVWKFMAQLDCPVMISEFHFGALDRGMFGTSRVGAGTQEGRGQMYQAYVSSVAAVPWMVGCHWLQWSDQPLIGRALDGENHNAGLVSVGDLPYAELTSAAAAIHRTIYPGARGSVAGRWHLSA